MELRNLQSDPESSESGSGEVNNSQLDEEFQDAKRRQHHLSLEYKLPSPARSRVCINVGGRKFETFLQTLLKYPSTLLGIMFKERNSVLLSAIEVGEDTEYFFDRNFVAFGAILDWYRTSCLVVPPDIPLRVMLIELDFWQIPLSVDDLTHDNSFGQKLRVQSIKKAEEQAGRLLEKLLELCMKGVESAAAEGCQFCKVDFLKGHSYLRASAGKDKSAPTKFHVNVVEKSYVAFLRDDSHVHLLSRRLRQHGLTFTFTSIGSSAKNYCFNFNLWAE